MWYHEMKPARLLFPNILPFIPQPFLLPPSSFHSGPVPPNFTSLICCTRLILSSLAREDLLLPSRVKMRPSIIAALVLGNLALAQFTTSTSTGKHHFFTAVYLMALTEHSIVSLHHTPGRCCCGWRRRRTRERQPGRSQTGCPTRQREGQG